MCNHVIIFAGTSLERTLDIYPFPGWAVTTEKADRITSAHQLLIFQNGATVAKFMLHVERGGQLQVSMYDGHAVFSVDRHCVPHEVLVATFAVVSTSVRLCLDDKGEPELYVE